MKEIRIFFLRILYFIFRLFGITTPSIQIVSVNGVPLTQLQGADGFFHLAAPPIRDVEGVVTGISSPAVDGYLYNSASPSASIHANAPCNGTPWTLNFTAPPGFQWISPIKVYAFVKNTPTATSIEVYIP